jgi:hypothetical protein
MLHPLRLVAAVAAGLLVSTLTPGTASAAPADRSSGWLSRQLTDGAVVFPQYGDFVDYGMTADVAYALKAIGGHADDLTQIRRTLAENVDSWTGTGDFVSGGSTAKAVVAAQVTGANARSFGGVDVVARLEDRISDAKPIVGRLEDKSPDTDYANTFAQAIAARGLARARSAGADEAIRFLLKQQCSPGYFRLNFTPDKAAAKQSCDAGTEAESAPDTDATALAVLSLDAMPRAAKTKAVKNAIADASAWLRKSQKANGSHGGGTSTEASNTNSTGLAAWALGETGSCRAASKAADWVQGLQVRGDVAGTPLAGQKGAIAYDRKALREARADGITDDTQYQWRSATSNAAPALGYLSCR